ncbi:hypothetical protein EIP91_009074 [Steccherinum ochraceum]|uniref:F-box domain-containing protein n=1 Tax=Steccherinum ochraceum TaxID=92696 RepID=A0A4R0R230_9APHY|nr:hypothetical protein EIP91_009074 [Steccherinum ochraceum]
MNISSLPAELLAMIIDHLHGDNNSLLASSQVARSWTEPSHYHLFHRLSVFVLEPEWFSRLLALLESSERARCYISHMVLWTSHWTGFAAYEPMCHHIISRILSKTQNLKSLTLSGVHLQCRHGFVPEHDIEHPSPSTNLETFSLYRCQTDTRIEPVLAYLLGCCTSIGYVQLQKYTPPVKASPLPDLSHLRIRHLDIESHGADDLLPALKICPPVLAVTLVVTSQVLKLAQFISGVGRDLRALWLRLPSSSSYLRRDITGSDFKDGLILPCKGLQALHISTHTDTDPYSRLGPEENLLAMWDSVTHILSSIPAGLSDLTLDFSVHAESRDFFRQAVHWEDMDTTLSALRSLASMVVTIRVVETEFDDDYEV